MMRTCCAVLPPSPRGYFDVTKAGTVRAPLGPHARECAARRRAGRRRDRGAVAGVEIAQVKQGDWFFTGELFSEEERPGFSDFLASRARAGWRRFSTMRSR